jgi:Zn-dependent membrane protease YugP
MFGFDPLYWLVIGIGMVMSLWASARVKGAFARYSKVPTRAQITGAQVAERILAESQVQGVKIEAIRGELSDHYDPRSHTLRLSEKIFSGRSLAAVGVAAHEAGHAIQHARGNPMLAFRSRWVPMANLGSRF